MRPVANQPESQTTLCKPQRPRPAQRLRHPSHPLDSVRESGESPHLPSELCVSQSANPLIQFLESVDYLAQANSAPGQHSTDRRPPPGFSVRASPAPPACARLALQTLPDETKRSPTRPLCFRFAAAETPSPSVSPTDTLPRH